MMSRLAINIKEELELNEEQYEVLRYGLNGLKITVINLMVSFFLGLLLKILIPVLLFLWFFIPLRICSGGFHFKGKVLCFIFSQLPILLLPLLEKITFLQNVGLCLGIWLICGFFTIKMAPVGNAKKLIDKSRVNLYKKYSTRVIFIESIFLFFFIFLGQSVYWKAILAAMMINIFSLFIGNIVEKNV